VAPFAYVAASDVRDETRAAKGEAFRFASEKDAGESDGEPVDLPNWRRGNGTIIN
jgi:hypothetical protein